MQHPIYTDKADCQDCYKCVRNCPVKAIRVESGSAMVIPEYCILCGECVAVCPAGAKKVRNDLPALKQLISGPKKVILSVAPSYLSEFDGVSPGSFVSAMKALGFHGVSETALGAQEVSAGIARMLDKTMLDKSGNGTPGVSLRDKTGDCGEAAHRTVIDEAGKAQAAPGFESVRENSGQLLISSACPSVVLYISKYQPENQRFLTPLLSPVLSHARLLRSLYGDDIAVAFAGPCIAKKIESDMYPELLDAVITFEELRAWMEEENISFGSVVSATASMATSEDSAFIPFRAKEGALYPVEGGMNAGIRALSASASGSFMSFSGIRGMEKALHGIDRINTHDNIFIELLACDGGCINGPKGSSHCSSVWKRHRIVSNTEYSDAPPASGPPVSIECSFDIKPVVKGRFSDEQLMYELARIGKTSQRDELNCAGCGYDSCRDFAVSLIEGKSEPKMCVSYMRSLAQKKANALMKTIPSGIVIVDDELKIVECNEIFARLMGEETMMLYDVKPGLEGALLERILPFHRLFRNVLESGEDMVGKEIEYNGSVLLFSIFTIEKGRYTGGIFRDITEPSVQKEQVINKAREVIKKNLSTVQKIAYLLGENAAESEVILNGIINSFSHNRIDDEMQEDD